jgi:hypothetical protein
MKVGDRIKVVADGFGETEPSIDNLIGWTGVITKIWPDGSLRVDLDPEQDPECPLDALAFEVFEVEVIQ